MSKVVICIILCCLALLTLASCECHTVPEDYQPATLDPHVAVRSSDTIVLGYPTARRDIRKVPVRQRRLVSRVNLVETETTLHVLLVIKGIEINRELKYRHYSVEAGMIVGAPEGPSDHLGTRGIYFLRRISSDLCRSVVDQYRPDISARWIKSASVESRRCDEPARCIADLLLTHETDDDVESFLASLQTSVAVARQLVGFLPTLELLNTLSDAPADDKTSQEACVVLSEWYPLALSDRCRMKIANCPAEARYLDRLAKVQQLASAEGLKGLLRRVQPKEDAEVDRYIALLARSSDRETRRLASQWLSEWRKHIKYEGTPVR